MWFKRLLLSVALLTSALVAAQAVNINGVDGTGANKVVAIGFPRLSVTDGITAFAGGAQTSAVLLTSAVNRVSTVASAGDSVKLPPCRSGAAAGIAAGTAFPSNSIGVVMYVINSAASNSMDVFPSTGGSINAVAANGAYAVAANKTVGFICSPAGTIWYSLLGG